jgi:hypothetical protein
MSMDLNDTFLIHTMTTISNYEYSQLRMKYITADMKPFFVFTFNSYLFSFKTRINNGIIILIIFSNVFLKTLKNIVFGCNVKSIVSLKTIFESGNDPVFVNFYSQDPNVLSLFQSYHYESNCTLNMSVIQPFFDRILNIICNHNIYFYFYIINWISFLIGKLGSKIETPLVIIDEQATGNNKFFAVIISELDSIVLLRIKY